MQEARVGQTARVSLGDWMRDALGNAGPLIPLCSSGLVPVGLLAAA